MPDLDLRPERRAAVAEALLVGLGVIGPTARVSLRGSLADGRADQYSDIDLLVTVDASGTSNVGGRVVAAVAAVQPVRLVRIEPAKPTTSRRMLYILLQGLPLFWRVDIEVVTTSATGATGQSTWGTAPTWSLPASALMNAVAAIKALARAQNHIAEELLARGWHRIGVHRPHGELAREPAALAHACAALDPDLTDLATECAELVDALAGNSL